MARPWRRIQGRALVDLAAPAPARETLASLESPQNLAGASTARAAAAADESRGVRAELWDRTAAPSTAATPLSLGRTPAPTIVDHRGPNEAIVCAQNRAAGT